MLDIRHFIVDPDDGDSRLHFAAFDGDVQLIEQLLSNSETLKHVNRRIRPYGATPLRLAATSGHSSCIQFLIDCGADIDHVDIKSQTPLFVAVQKKHTNCVKLLLENGADPNGSDGNRCSPLFIAAKDGCLECVKLLLKFGAKTELIGRSLEIPGFPLHISAIYQHYECYVTLLLAGAEPDLRRVNPPLSSLKIAQSSLAHALVRHQCSVNFAKCFMEFGGYLWQLDMKGRLATEMMQEGNCKSFFQIAIGEPLCLLSLCRITIRRYIGYQRFDKILTLPIPLQLINFLLFKNLTE